MWKRIVVVALLLSLGANVWLVKRARDVDFQARQGFMNAADLPVQWLRFYVQQVQDPKADWNSLTFRLGLAQLLERAAFGAQATAQSTMGVIVGPRWEVANGLNWLGSELMSYDSLAWQIAGAPGPVAPDKQAKLEQLAAKLKEGGWPGAPIARDDTAGWAQFATVLQQLRDSNALFMRQP